ncbi:MAG: ATP-dependent DNA helicase RecG [Parcubacteria group bacterium Gr01-1014_30]|nr:MAG: ATP-dependent DNA helicase RecG [Parcubacteria group bacterium Gr01-1014_30]
MELSTPVEKVPRVGPWYQKRLKRLGIKTVRDIIFHFPHRYEDFSNLIPIAHIEEGGPAFAEASSGKPFCFQGEITDLKNIRTFRKRMVLTQATLKDQTGTLKAIWFNQPYLISTFKKGDYVCLAGKVTKKGRAMYLSGPAYEKIRNPKSEVLNKLQIPNSNLTHTGRLIPVYPETEGLSSKWLRFIVKPVLLEIKDKLPDPLPQTIRQKFDFLPLNQALWQIHFPDNLESSQEAKKRFAFEELFELSIFVLRERLKLAKEKAQAVPLNLGVIKEFVGGLPFKLTSAQKKAAWQILKDLEKPRPMNRLLEGDVGSGKTVVAAIAILNVVKAGFQTAFMAPTEILANQHYDTFDRLLAVFDIKVGLMTGKKKIKEEADVTVGTHALIQEGVKFPNLALVVVDEQHRFGVEQRARLCRGYGGQAKLIPHLLSMTATPIPRTLSLTVFGDLDLSLLDEMPEGRKKVITKIVKPQEKRETYEFIREKVKAGRQVFVICPRIEPSKTSNGQLNGQVSQRQFSWLDVKAVKQEYEKLSKDVFPDLKVGMLHGKMKTKEKEQVMQNFKEGEIDVLVATSVVEVGVDIPNATIMLIEGAEKFGLAQLHQFRGRVGRGQEQSWCFLFTESPGLITNRRLRALVSSDSGFELAEKDLKIRGPGDFSGQRQWGLPDLAMASLADVSLVEKARNEAKDILHLDPELEKYPLLRERLREFRERVHLE